ncbi:hypothetical protein DNG35_07615 [Mesonia sp. K7]|nr:hypothetical protein DNG35_07615 [Mesonia sp. K7]
MLTSSVLWSQVEKPKAQIKIEELQAQKETVEKLEKEKLKLKVKTINERLEAREISQEKADELKQEAAKLHAMNIENQYDLIDLNIDLIKRNQSESLAQDFYIDIGAVLTDTKKMSALDSIPRVFFPNTYVGLGISTVANQSQDAYENVGFNFFAGVKFTTVFSRASPEYRLNYGLELTSNIVGIKDSKIFVNQANQAELVESPIELDRSSFSLVNLVVPVHFEFGKTKIDYSEDRAMYDLNSDWNYGIGGFLGVKIGFSQSFKYEDEGETVRQSIQRPYNTEDFLYGLSAYAGYGPLKLNIRYHLNSIFENSNANGNMLSAALIIGY